MTIVAAPDRIASAYVVAFGCYGDVTRYAHERGVCRQAVYRQAAWVQATLAGNPWQAENDRLRRPVRDLERRLAELERRLADAVVLDRDKQAQFACVGQ